MTLAEAEKIVQAYGAAMAAGTVDGTRRDPRLLPTTPDRILTAIKLTIAFLVQNGSHSEKNVHPLVITASFIDSFSDTARDPMEFLNSMRARQGEIDQFFITVSKFDRTDPLFWQRVYTELGLAYEERKVSLWQTLTAGFRGTH